MNREFIPKGSAVVTALAGIFSATLGMIVLIGWHMHATPLVQVDPDFVPMQYNTALAFLVSGAGLAALAFDRGRIGVACGAVGIAVGILSLAEHLSGWDFGIDQVLFAHTITVRTPSPGRMAPNTALSFIMTGFALVRAASPSRRRHGLMVAGILGSLVFGLGFVALSGYFARLETAYGWGRMTPMALHTAAGFVILGVGITVFAWGRDRNPAARLPDWFPYPLVIGIMTIQVALWLAVHYGRAEDATLATALGLGTGIGFAIALGVTAAMVHKSWLREETLAIANARFGAIMDNSSDSMILLDLDGCCVAINVQGAARFKRRPDQLVGKNIFPILPPELAEERRKIFDAVVRSKRPFFHEDQRDGLLLDNRLHPVLDANGDVFQVAIVSRDITQARKDEESRTRLGRIIEKSFNEIYVFDAETLRFVLVNQGARNNLGYSSEELTGLTPLDLNPEFTRESFSSMIAPLRDGSRDMVRFETIHRRKDGSFYAVDVRLQLLAEEAPPVFVAIVLDLTDRKRSEDEIRLSRNRLQTIMNAAPALIASVDKDQRYRFANVHYQKMFGVNPETIVGSSVRQVLGEQNYLHALPAIERVLAGEVVRVEASMVDRNGMPNAFEGLLTPELDGEGKVAGWFVFLINVSERKGREAALAESERRFRTLVENIPQKIFLKDTNSVYVSCNQAYAADLGIDEEDIAGRTDFDFYPRELAEKYRKDDAMVMASRSVVDMEEQYVRNGQAFVVQTVKVPVRDDRGRITGVFGIFWDITQRKRLEEDLIQSQKMQAIGQLTGGVAHDFNNILQVILGNLALLRAEVDDAHAWTEMLDDCIASGGRGAALTRQLLACARKQPLNPRAEDANGLITDMIHLLGRTLGENIEIETFLDRNLPPVKADPSALQNAILNLALNARAAMPDGGVLTMRTERADGDFVRVTVSDNGSGMPPEVVSRAFEPFFTTRPSGDGTGLGLSMVQGFAKQSGGDVSLESTVGIGTSVRLLLPIATEAATRPAVVEGDASRPHPKVAGLTVLVVEDDPEVRKVGVRVLGQLGHQVLEAGDGPSALGMLDRHPEIQLVVSDVMMPGGMNGLDLARRIRARGSTVKLILVSGYPAQAASTASLGQEFPFLEKPYGHLEMADAIDALFG